MLAKIISQARASHMGHITLKFHMLITVTLI